MHRRVSAVPVAGLLVGSVVVAGCTAATATDTRGSAPTATRHLQTIPSATATGRTHATVVPEAATAHRLISRCPSTHAVQVVVVSIGVQHAWLCHRGTTVRSFPVTTGRSTPNTRTPIGHFRVQGRNRNSVLTLGSGRQYDVKYWIPFEAPDFGFHDAPWQHIPFGSRQYREHGSHGCIHLPSHAVAFLYRWVEIGARVVIERT